MQTLKPFRLAEFFGVVLQEGDTTLYLSKEIINYLYLIYFKQGL